MNKIFKLICALSVFGSASASAEWVRYKNFKVNLEVPSNWKIERDLFGMPISVLGPEHDKSRAVFSVEPTDVYGFKFDQKAIKADRGVYYQAKREWVNTQDGGKFVSEIPFRELNLTNNSQGQEIGTRYQLRGQTFDDKSIQIICGGRMFILKQLTDVNYAKTDGAVMDGIVNSFQCAKVTSADGPDQPGPFQAAIDEVKKNDAEKFKITPDQLKSASVEAKAELVKALIQFYEDLEDSHDPSEDEASVDHSSTKKFADVILKLKSSFLSTNSAVAKGGLSCGITGWKNEYVFKGASKSCPEPLEDPKYVEAKKKCASSDQIPCNPSLFGDGLCVNNGDEVQHGTVMCEAKFEKTGKTFVQMIADKGTQYDQSLLNQTISDTSELCSNETYANANIGLCEVVREKFEEFKDSLSAKNEEEVAKALDDSPLFDKFSEKIDGREIDQAVKGQIMSMDQFADQCLDKNQELIEGKEGCSAALLKINEELDRVEKADPNAIKKSAASFKMAPSCTPAEEAADGCSAADAKKKASVQCDFLHTGGKCLAGLAGSVGNFIWGTIKGLGHLPGTLWSLGKGLVTANWTAGKMIATGLWDTLVRHENLSTTWAHMCSQISDPTLKEFVADPIGKTMDLVKKIHNAAIDFLQNDLFCAKWDGVPHLFGSKCIQPANLLCGLTCDEITQGTCNAIGYIAGFVLETIATGGAAAYLKGTKAIQITGEMAEALRARKLGEFVEKMGPKFDRYKNAASKVDGLMNTKVMKALYKNITKEEEAMQAAAKLASKKLGPWKRMKAKFRALRDKGFVKSGKEWIKRMPGRVGGKLVRLPITVVRAELKAARKIMSLGNKVLNNKLVQRMYRYGGRIVEGRMNRALARAAEEAYLAGESNFANRPAPTREFQVKQKISSTLDDLSEQYRFREPGAPGTPKYDAYKKVHQEIADLKYKVNDPNGPFAKLSPKELQVKIDEESSKIVARMEKVSAPAISTPENESLGAKMRADKNWVKSQRKSGLRDEFAYGQSVVFDAGNGEMKVGFLQKRKLAKNYDYEYEIVTQGDVGGPVTYKINEGKFAVHGPRLEIPGSNKISKFVFSSSEDVFIRNANGTQTKAQVLKQLPNGDLEVSIHGENGLETKTVSSRTVIRDQNLSWNSAAKDAEVKAFRRSYETGDFTGDNQYITLKNPKTGKSDYAKVFSHNSKGIMVIFEDGRPTIIHHEFLEESKISKASKNAFAKLEKKAGGQQLIHNADFYSNYYDGDARYVSRIVNGKPVNFEIDNGYYKGMTARDIEGNIVDIDKNNKHEFILSADSKAVFTAHQESLAKLNTELDEASKSFDQLSPKAKARKDEYKDLKRRLDELSAKAHDPKSKLADLELEKKNLLAEIEKGFPIENNPANEAFAKELDLHPDPLWKKQKKMGFRTKKQAYSYGQPVLIEGENGKQIAYLTKKSVGELRGYQVSWKTSTGELKTKWVYEDNFSVYGEKLDVPTKMNKKLIRFQADNDVFAPKVGGGTQKGKVVKQYANGDVDISVAGPNGPEVRKIAAQDLSLAEEYVFTTTTTTKSKQDFRKVFEKGSFVNDDQFIAIQNQAGGKPTYAKVMSHDQSGIHVIDSDGNFRVLSSAELEEASISKTSKNLFDKVDKMAGGRSLINDPAFQFSEFSGESRYLSYTDGRGNVHFFEVMPGNKATGTSGLPLRDIYGHSVDLPESELHKLVISPESKTAFVQKFGAPPTGVDPKIVYKGADFSQRMKRLRSFTFTQALTNATKADAAKVQAAWDDYYRKQDEAMKRKPSSQTPGASP